MQTENPELDNNIDTRDESALHGASEESGQELTPGAVLQAERLRQNLSEKDISDELHITMHYVRAIESNRFDKLPGAVFSKGYIKSYAQYLKMDVDAVAMLFDGINSEQQGMQQEANRRHMAQRRSDRNKPWVFASAACFVLVFGGLWAFNYYGGDSVEQTATPVNQAPAVASIASRPIAQTPAPAIPPEAAAELQSSVLQSTASQTTVPQTTVPQTSVPQTLTEQASAQPITADAQAIPSQFAGSVASADILETPSSTQAIEPVAVSGELTVPGTAQAPGVQLSTAAVENHVFVAGEAGDDLLRINFSGESWVEVNDSQSNQIYRDIRAAGDVLEITGDAPFSVLLGDAPFITLFLNGNEIDVSDDIRIDNSARLTVGL